MPTYANPVERSPTGRIVTPQGDVEYWVELENPFAYFHNEYLVIRRNDKEHRLKVPMFNGPVAAYASGNSPEELVSIGTNVSCRRLCDEGWIVSPGQRQQV